MDQAVVNDAREVTIAAHTQKQWKLQPYGELWCRRKKEWQVRVAQSNGHDEGREYCCLQRRSQ